jgi:hypothetical protein
MMEGGGWLVYICTYILSCIRGVRNLGSAERHDERREGALTFGIAECAFGRLVIIHHYRIQNDE